MGANPQQPGKANLDVFSQTLMELAESDRDIMVVTSDSRGSGKLTLFAEKFPEQLVEMGIAEQNLVGVSAGLASAGKKVFAVSPACFLTARALEQIKNDVAYSDNPVKVIGISAGVSYGSLGSAPITPCTISPPCKPSTILILLPRQIISRPAQSSAPLWGIPARFTFALAKSPCPICTRRSTQFRNWQGHPTDPATRVL
jgi:hypothetical protein